MKLVFRKIDADKMQDIAQFKELMDDLSERARDDELLHEKIVAMNAREDIWLMVAEDTESGRLCGSIMAVICDDVCGTCAPFMLIENVVTHHEFRRRGVGRKMFEAVEDWGIQHGVRYVILCSANHREQAHGFYPTIGYEEIKGYKKYL